MLKQVFVINTDLGMGKGKTAVQAAHAEVLYMNHLNKLYFNANTELIEFDEWMKDGIMKKVVLKASEAEIKTIIQILDNERLWYDLVFDLGFTQVPANSLTCLITEPLEEELTDKLFGHLKLL